jgi:hypothetical protein
VALSGFAARPEVWIGAGEGIGRAAQILRRAVDALNEKLAAVGPAWGGDPLGTAFFTGSDGSDGFGPLMDQLLRSLADMVNVLMGTGAACALCGQRYARADQASCFGASSAGASYVGFQPYKPGTVPSAAGRPDPTPLWLREWLRRLQVVALEIQWPDANVIGLASIRDELNTTAKAVDEVRNLVDGHAGSVTTANSGTSADAFGLLAASICGDGVDSALSHLASACSKLAGLVDSMIRSVNAARIEIISVVSFLVISFVVTRVFMATPYGAALDVGIESFIEKVAGDLSTFLKDIATEIVDALWQLRAGVWYSGGTSLIEQLVQWSQGLGFSGTQVFEAFGEGMLANWVINNADLALELSADRRANSVTPLGLETGFLSALRDIPASMGETIEKGGWVGHTVDIAYGTGTGTIAYGLIQFAVTGQVDWAEAVGSGSKVAALDDVWDSAFGRAGRALARKQAVDAQTAAEPQPPDQPAGSTGSQAGEPPAEPSGDKP